MSAGSLHPLLARAAEGELPSWAEAGEARRDHIRRVTEVLEGWAEALERSPPERARWRAVGTLHDALREADPERLREEVPPRFRALPGSLLHGPAAAERLRREGVEDEGVLRAVAYHTVGHPSLDAAGQALYAADYLEPGRTQGPDREHEAERHRRLREVFPTTTMPVLREVARARLLRLLERGWRIPPETMEFWNSLREG